MSEGYIKILSFTHNPSSPTTPGDIFIHCSLKNIGEGDVCFARIYLDDNIIASVGPGYWEKNIINNFGVTVNLSIGIYSCYLKTGHLVDSTEVIDETAEQTIIIIEGDEGWAEIQYFNSNPPSPINPGEVWINGRIKNIGATDDFWLKYYKNGVLMADKTFTGLTSNSTWGYNHKDSINETTYYLMETGHFEDSTMILDATAEQTVIVLPPQGDLCDWITDKGGINALLITDIFIIIDSYIFNTIPPGNYGFIPTLQNVFGVIDYYLGFDGDSKTGCDFF